MKFKLKPVVVWLSAILTVTLAISLFFAFLSTSLASAAPETSIIKAIVLDINPIVNAVVASFEGTPTSGSASLDVQFTNLSTGDLTTCDWDFGDGSTISDCGNPTHTYTAEGIYTVSLTAHGADETQSTETRTDYITVYTPSQADFSGSPTSGPAPLGVTFTNTSAGDYDTCSWTFGDGGSSSQCTPGLYTYNNPGIYTVSLTVSGNGGTDTEEKTNYITVYTPSQAVFSGNPTSGPAPLGVTFTNTSTGDYNTCSWTFGDGGSSSLCSPGLHTYNTPGNYTVSLTVSGNGGTDSEEKTNYITVYTPSQAVFSGNPTSGPAPLGVTFSNSSTGDFNTCSWTFGDGGSSNNCSPGLYTYNTPGSYTVSLTVSGNGGTDTEEKTNYITVYTPSQANFSANHTSGNAPLTVTFSNLSSGDYSTCLWDFGDQTTSTDCTDPSHTYNDDGIYTVSLTVDGNGGQDTETKADYISVYQGAHADFSANPKTGNAPLLVSFTNASTGDFDTCTWDFGDGSQPGNVCEDPSHTYNSPGTYTVSLTVSGAGGEDSEIKSGYITVYTASLAQFSASPSSGIAPLTVNFDNQSTGDFDTCSWEFGDGGTSSSCNDQEYIYSTPGVYDVTLTVNGNGGQDSEVKIDYITVYAPSQVAFSANPTSGIAPLNVNFDNQSTGDFSSCSWDFGDGGTSSSCNDQAYTYNSPGVYDVTLTITGNGGQDSELKTDYITVYAPSVADFSASPTIGNAPLAVTFTNLSSGDYTTCSWNFGDGGSSSNCAPPAHTYNNPGIYTVSLTVNGNGGQDTETKTDYIAVYRASNAAFIATPLSGLSPLTVNFTNQSSGDYEACTWDFGDGNTSTSCSNPSHTYNTRGKYTVSLTVNGDGGEDTETKTDYISVYQAVVADFSGSPTVGITPLVVNFTNNSTGDFDTCTWDFGDGSTSSECNNPSHTYNSGGVYTVKLTVKGGGGQSTMSKTSYITVYQKTVADFSATPVKGIAPQVVNFTNQSTGDFNTCTWDFGDGSTSNSCGNPSHTYNALGTHTVTLTVKGNGGEDTETKVDYITIYESVFAEFSASPTTGIVSFNVTFTNQSGGDYTTCTWNFGDGSTLVSCGNPTHTYSTSGIFTVSLKVSGGGGENTETKTKLITAYKPSSANFSATPTEGVIPLKVNFTNQSTGDYDTCIWDFGDGGSSTTCGNPSYTYNAPGVYTIALTVRGNGGESAVEKIDYITVLETLDANFSADPYKGSAPLHVIFTNKSYGDYSTCSWNFGDGSTSNSCLNPDHTYQQSGIYTVSLTINGTGGENTETKANFIFVANEVIYIPFLNRNYSTP